LAGAVLRRGTRISDQRAMPRSRPAMRAMP
jgi:hypothetical protein